MEKKISTKGSLSNKRALYGVHLFKIYLTSFNVYVSLRT